MKQHLLPPAVVAEALGLTTGHLAQMRYTGGGPKYIKVSGRAVRYRWEDVEAWIAGRERTSTSEPSPAA